MRDARIAHRWKVPGAGDHSTRTLARAGFHSRSPNLCRGPAPDYVGRTAIYSSLGVIAGYLSVWHSVRQKELLRHEPSLAESLRRLRQVDCLRCTSQQGQSRRQLPLDAISNRTSLAHSISTGELAEPIECKTSIQIDLALETGARSEGRTAPSKEPTQKKVRLSSRKIAKPCLPTEQLDECSLSTV